MTMRRNRMTATLVLLVLVGASSSIYATPMTFQFDLPSWTASNPSLFGTNATTLITVDNASSSSISQIYENGHILELTVDTTGTYSNTWFASDIILAVPSLAESYISTDAAGIPFLDLTDDPVTSVVKFDNAGGTFQLGAFASSGGGFTPVFLWSLPGSAGDVVSIASSDSPLAGSIVPGATVPVPGTILLLGLGLAGLSWSRRKRAYSIDSET